jgi:galactosylxylosylprotein 3-beta-galactosyltransferase
LEDIVDTYQLLTSKVLGAFRWAHENHQFKYLMKVDDDSFVRLDVILQELEEERDDRFVDIAVFLDGSHDHQGSIGGTLTDELTLKRLGSGARRFDWCFLPANKLTSRQNWHLCDLYLPYAVGGGYVLAHTLVDFVARNHHLLSHYLSEVCGLSW